MIIFISAIIIIDINIIYSLFLFFLLLYQILNTSALYSVKIRCDDEEKVVSWYLKVDGETDHYFGL